MRLFKGSRFPKVVEPKRRKGKTRVLRLPYASRDYLRQKEIDRKNACLIAKEALNRLNANMAMSKLVGNNYVVNKDFFDALTNIDAVMQAEGETTDEFRQRVLQKASERESNRMV